MLFGAVFLLANILAPCRSGAAAPGLPAPDIVETANGSLQGTATVSGVRVFKGIPYAQPPVGDLRWKPPQPPRNWDGVRMADTFGPRAMQLPLFGDMVFRSNGMSEDCLYLNVWTPAKSDKDRLPVLVYFFGGGFVGGDGSEPRYDGESMARRGIVSITVTFRLGVFGFMALPELVQESPHHASGNYGLMDQSAALEWVRRNIATFGGDPEAHHHRRRVGGVLLRQRANGFPLVQELDRRGHRRERRVVGEPRAHASGSGRTGRGQVRNQPGGDLAGGPARPARGAASRGHRPPRFAPLQRGRGRRLPAPIPGGHLCGRSAGARAAAGRLELPGGKRSGPLRQGPRICLELRQGS